MLHKYTIPHTLRSLYSRYGRLARFGLVGVTGVVINTALLWLFTRFAQLPVLVASALATEVAMLSNFWLNDRWTFRAANHRHGVIGRLLRYNGIALDGLIITVGLLALLTTFAHLPLLLANLLAIAGALAWNYLINTRWTWQTSQAPVANDTTRPL